MQKKIISSKISPLLKKGKNPNSEELFEVIKKYKGIPDIAQLYLEGHLSIEDILNLRNNFDGQKFRHWISNFESSEEEFISELVKAEPKVNPAMKLVRFIVPELLNLKLPGIGKPIKLLDSLYLDRLYKMGWHPNFYIDNKLLKITRAKEIDQIKEKRYNDFVHRFGKVGRNEKCPCGSDRKFKHCHGKK